MQTVVAVPALFGWEIPRNHSEAITSPPTVNVPSGLVWIDIKWTKQKVLKYIATILLDYSLQRSFSAFPSIPLETVTPRDEFLPPEQENQWKQITCHGIFSINAYLNNCSMRIVRNTSQCLHQLVCDRLLSRCLRYATTQRWHIFFISSNVKI